MNYSFFINDTLYISGNLTQVLTYICGALIVMILIYIHVWRMRRQHDVAQQEFISIITHKFRTPLTQVKWLIETILTNEQDPFRRQDLTHIKESNEKLVTLMQTLLSLTNTNEGDKNTYTLERIDMYEFVKKIGDDMRHLFQEKNISFTVEQTKLHPMVKINPIGLQFVIQTLLQNSCIYSHPGKHVRVIVSKHWWHVRVSVVDAGIGITASEKRKLFTKFYRGEQASKMDTDGFGVSLFISKSIIQRNKGSIKAYSEGTEKGSLFIIKLPRVH